ncbi:pseudo histidine-containing phosphotransfer protein 2 isoform X3 [Ricinus communis]|uniref:pseudo histidine-containing phosphotransfer protein 2 isoform X3 n=1 Tax=Ricinus communis TaxID=3988 RepID=UPI000772C826|nr:pseudo histidine-containing phosphotransfer protein 2 isoform X3 [Ricinus communis]|eukprot:XP_015571692.1 pseudo histidine-containing phosphotransfer protein 2 isoform X3 [Ricinus communis]
MDNLLREQIAKMRQSFFDEGTLDSHYFAQLEQLEGPDNPNFVEEIITLFFRESTKMLATMETNLIGAIRIKEQVIPMLNNLKENNLEGAKASFQGLKVEYDTLKRKLEPYFQLQRQAGPVETAVPPK